MPKRVHLIKTGLSLLFVINSIFCSAQEPLMGIFLGPQITSANYHAEAVKQSTRNKYGFHAGFTMKIPFETNVYFSPAAFYSLKGYKVKLTNFVAPPDTLAVDNNTSMHTFELAFLLQFDVGSKPDHFFFKAGPTLDFQLVGKEKFNLRNGGSVSRNMKYSFGDYGRYAANLLMQFGFETGKGFMIFGQYSFGLTNLNNADEGPRMSHRVYGLSVGKYFNSGKKS